MSAQGSRLHGKVAIVTGGGSGFGAAIIQRFSKEGAKVILGDVNAENGQKVASKEPAHIVFLKMDVTKADHWYAAIELAFSKFGWSDILVNNAGTSPCNKPTLKVTEAEWERIFDINVTKGLAAEFSQYNICVNKVCPLLSSTGLFSMFTGMEVTPENRQKFIGNVPLGRLTDSDDIANMCLYLASDKGRFVTGMDMIVDSEKSI
ncbi:hypothetical protein BJX65DRAFT_300441 [Aspergillus insuetus]